METTIQLLCPECAKGWQRPPTALPDATDSFECPDCHASRRTAEFARTDRDLRVLHQFG